LIKGIIKWLSR